MFRLLLFCSIVILIEAKSCPEGSISSSLDPNRCYMFQQTSANYFEAEADCRKQNGHLTAIDNAFTNDFLFTQAQENLKADDFWIGGAFLSQSNWTWLDKTTFSYNDWARNEPSTEKGADCIAFSSSPSSQGTWSAQKCFQKKPYVCSTLLTASSGRQTCDIGWFYFKESDSCYKALPQSNWTNAEGECVGYESHLASIHSQNENIFVGTISWLTSYQSWFGLYYSSEKYHFVYSDKTSVDYTSWYQLYNYSSYCSCISFYGFRWNTDACSTSYTAICKKPA